MFPHGGLKFSCQPGSCQSDARSRTADERQSDTSSSASCVARCQWHISPRHCNSPDGGSGERHPPSTSTTPTTTLVSVRIRCVPTPRAGLNTQHIKWRKPFVSAHFISLFHFLPLQLSTKAAGEGQSLHSVGISHLLFHFVGKYVFSHANQLYWSKSWKKNLRVKKHSKEILHLTKSHSKKKHTHKNTWTLAWIQFYAGNWILTSTYKKKKKDDNVSASNLHSWTDCSGGKN